MKVTLSPWVLLSAVSLLGGCHETAPPGAVIDRGETVTVKAPDIEWFHGTVDAAFEQARASDKPVFLFWGAVWCPYCKALKASVFARNDFIEQSRQFIAVYLDGDDAGAQKQAEGFHINGYPTVLILKPDRTELARLSGGMDLTQYASVLDLALADARPVAAILNAVTKISGATSATLSREDCRRLAYNAWDLESMSVKSGLEAAQSLARAADRCPGDEMIGRARLIFTAADMATSALSSIPRASADAQEGVRRIVARTVIVLSDRTLSVGAGDAASALGTPFFMFVRSTMPREVQALRARWVAVTEAITLEPRFNPGQRLEAVASNLRGLKALDGKKSVDAAVEKEARQSLTMALSATREPLARAGVVNAALHVYDELNDPRAAYELAKAEIPGSNTPYYYMADAGVYAEELGRADEAIDWMARAYAQARGRATRFQWGSSYARALIRLKPNNEDQIVKAVTDVLSEVDRQQGVAQRSRARLARLVTSLNAWNTKGAHARAMKVLMPRIRELCGPAKGQATGTEPAICA